MAVIRLELNRLVRPETVRVVMLAAFQTLIVATLAYWMLVVCRLELTMFAVARLDRPETVRVVTLAPVNTLIVAIFIQEITFMYDILVVTPSTFVTLSVLEIKVLPKTLSDSGGVVDPMFAVDKKAFAKGKATVPIPEVVAEPGTIGAIILAVPINNVVDWTVIGPTKVARANTLRLDTLAVAILAVE